jgi:CheY-like chemotaxis protein
LVQRDIIPQSSAQSHLEQVFIASARAKDLVRQILTFSRQEELDRKALQLPPIIDETLNLLQALMPSTIEILRHIDADVPSVLGDPTQMQQVIMNLCANAGQAMSERGGVLEIRLSQVDIDASSVSTHPELKEGPHILLAVSDTGCGMDRAIQERIFDPFFTTKGPGKGTGLGLAVVHGVIKHHGGAIAVQSQPGVGTTFSVYLPAFGGQAADAVHQPGLVPAGNGEHVLFVDDEEPLTLLGKSTLEHLGYRVTTKANGAEALMAFRAEPSAFDLVITDQTMPHMTGADLATALLQIRPELPVILVTGYSGTMSSERAKALGIRELLLKPNTMQAMGQAIRSALGPIGRE